MKLKRILAMVLCVAMVLSMMGTSVFAEGDTPAVTAVAKIGETEYASVADALSAAQDGDVVNLIWEESDDPIAMNGSVYGKSVTITGTATVDWSKGNLFVGRGGEGDGTVIFDGANLASASDQASTGIHVSGREKETSNKYNGTLIIKNSTIELDYLINRGTINVDNSMLTVKKGFGIAGRPASETESGEAATATINITNNSYVKVLNHNGMGIGVASATPEGKGILNLTDSTFECASFNVDADLGDFNVSGESTLKIAALTGKEINLLDGTILKDSIVGGHVLVLGVVTFRGDNTVALVEDYGNAYSAVGANWTVEAGASLTMTEKARWGFGYGDKATIIGTLTDALTARESLTEDDISLFTHGFVAMSSWDVAHSLVVKDAYVVIGDNNSFGNTSKSGYKGTYDIDFDNAVMDASRITFYEAGSKTDLSFVDSDVKVGTFMTRDKDSTFTLTNTKLLSTTDSNGTDEGNYHAGTMTLNNSDITYSAPLVMENGTLMLGTSSNITAPVITGAGVINVDASELKNSSATVINADMSGFTGTVSVTNNDDATYAITDAGLVISVVANASVTDSEGNVSYYATLSDALSAAQDGDTITLLANIVLENAVSITKTVTLDLNGFELTYNSTTQGEAMITNKGNLTINDSVGTGVINYNYTGAADSSYGKGNYTISNAGTLTVNGGKITIANLSGHAKYPIDNNSTTGDAVLVINGGHLYNYNTSAIRQFCNSTTYKNSVTVNGGLVEGYCAIWVQNPGSKTVNGSLVITGGEVKSTAKAYVNGTADLKDVSSAIYCTIAGNGGAWSNDSLVSITGGTINENVRLAEEAPAKINVNENICNGYVTVPAPEVSKNLVLFDYPIVEIEDKEYYRVAVASGIKSTSYAKVGFEVTIGEAEAVELYSTVVYKNMTATFDGVDTIIPASEFGAGSQYINFANLYFNTELYKASTPLTIRPFAVKFNGDYEYGKETTIDAIYTLGN